MDISLLVAQKIVRDAALELHHNLADTPFNITMFELGCRFSSTLLRTSVADVEASALVMSQYETALCDGINSGLQLHAETLGIAVRADPNRDYLGQLIN